LTHIPVNIWRPETSDTVLIGDEDVPVRVELG